MTVLTDVLNHPNIKRIFLAEITAGYEVRTWTLDTGTTYYGNASYKVINTKDNGASLTQRTTLADCRSNTGSWFYDTTNNRIYVNATGGVSPYTRTIQAIYQLYFSSHPVIFNDTYYEPRIEAIPNLSLRVEEKFTGVQQLGGGSVSFNNGDGYFDDIVGLQWSAGQTTIKYGADHISAMAYADYQIIGTWLNENWAITRDKFSLSLTEFKIKIKNKIPNTLYTRDAYPNIREKDIGRALQLAYGSIKDAAPVVKDVASRTFKLAGHAIVGIDAISVKNTSTGAWVAVSPTSTNLTTAEFTLSATDWTVNSDVSVNFRGKSTGVTLMENASDIVKDILLNYILEPSTNIDSDSFTNAYNDLDGGAYGFTTTRQTFGAISIYIDKPIEASKVISSINSSVGAYLFADSTGKYFYRVFSPVRSEGLIEFVDNDIISISRDVDSAVITKATVKYAKRHITGWDEIKTHEDVTAQYIQNLPSPNFQEHDTYLSGVDDATRLAQYIIAYNGVVSEGLKITVPSRIAATLMPSEFIHLIHARLGIDAVYEITGTNHNLSGDKTTLTLGNMHGLGDKPGFWVGGADTLPSRFANLSGYGSGSLSWNDAWDAQIKTWAIQNVGYWTDANGFNSTTDLTSRNKSSWV